MVRACVDGKRLTRLNAYKIVEGYRGSRDMPSITDFYSLPFDEEIQKMEREEMERVQQESDEVYRLAQQSGYFTMKFEDLTKN